MFRLLTLVFDLALELHLGSVFWPTLLVNSNSCAWMQWSVRIWRPSDRPSVWLAPPHRQDASRRISFHWKLSFQWCRLQKLSCKTSSTTHDHSLPCLSCWPTLNTLNTLNFPAMFSSSSIHHSFRSDWQWKPSDYWNPHQSLGLHSKINGKKLPDTNQQGHLQRIFAFFPLKKINKPGHFPFLNLE